MWGFAEEFKKINTPYNEGSACLSKDGKQLFFARCNSPDSYGNCDIFVAELKADSTWGNVKKPRRQSSTRMVGIHNLRFRIPVTHFSLPPIGSADLDIQTSIIP